ncbi:MAG: hypothetical protein ACTHU0_01355 [Kofleriaceae bacterium]
MIKHLASVIALSLALVLAGCGWLKDTSQSVAGAHVDCTTRKAKTQTAQLGTAVDMLLAAATAPDGKVDWTQLKAATRQFALDTGGCVLAASVARALTPTVPRADAPQSSPLQWDPVALAEGWEAVRAEQFGGRHFKLAGGTL